MGVRAGVTDEVGAISLYNVEVSRLIYLKLKGLSKELCRNVCLDC